MREIECQNFVRIEDYWVLLYSPDDTWMRYYTGRFDLGRSPSRCVPGKPGNSLGGDATP